MFHGHLVSKTKVDLTVVDHTSVMFYKFNSLIGRISPSSQAKAYVPQGLTPSPKPAGPFQFESTTVKAAIAPEVATVSSAVSEGSGAVRGLIPKSSGYASVLGYQKAWDASHSLMVWQKRGIRDSGPYWLTMILMTVSVGAVFSTIWKMSFPRKTEED